VAVLVKAYVPAGPTGRQGSGRTGSWRSARAKQAVEPQPTQRAVQQCTSVIAQNSAEAVVAAEAAKGPTRNHKEDGE